MPTPPGKSFTDIPDTRFTFQITFPDSGFGGMVLKPWGERKTPTKDYLPEVQQKLGAIPGIQMFPIMPARFPAVTISRSASSSPRPPSRNAFWSSRSRSSSKAMQAECSTSRDIDTKIDQPQAEIVFDHDKVAAMGLDMQQVGADLSARVGGNFVNRFNIDGRVTKSSRKSNASIA